MINGIFYESVITIGGKRSWLSRAIDADGDVLIILMQTRPNTKAAKRFFSRLMKQFGQQLLVATDELLSYIKPTQSLSPDEDHWAHKGVNNAIEISNRLTRKREEMSGRFKPARHGQRLPAARDQINMIFCPRGRKLIARSYPHECIDAFASWND